MDWLLATPQIHSAFLSLGSVEGDCYIVSPNALAILEEINYKLTYEDQTLRTFRRAIGFGQNVRSDLIPLLENAKDDDVLDAVIRILVNLTVPVECLFSVDIMYRTEVGRHTIFELNKLLYTSKEAFTDAKSTKSVVEFMKHILESDSKLSPQQCDQINNCLLLLRNILHIPESNANFIMPASHNPVNGIPPISMQNAILWNLFIQSIDKLLLYLMTCPQRASWGVTIAQLIGLMYKDQHVSTLQKLLNMWFEASLTESSEDNESNTSPPKQGSGEWSPMLTSDPTSDSSDNGGGSKNESSEDRRQALREETEATLQEVSRKGQEYQISILGGPSDGSDESSNNGTGEAPQGEENETIGGDGNNEDDAMQEEENENNYEDEEAVNSGSTCQQQQQPADRSDRTTKTELMDEDEANFMPPPSSLPRKSYVIATSEMDQGEQDNEDQTLADARLRPQKVPHSGQLNLTKGKCCPQKRECPSSQSELSDCGYGTQVENQESISTSSNEDDGPQGKPQHQKPPCNSKPRNKIRTILTVVDKKELRRKKLVKRSKSSLINMKGLVQHTPTDEDISNILKEFTVDFLLKGYGYLVQELHSQLLVNLKVPIDTSHFFWLVTYFLKFAAQLELDMEHINPILTYDIISYLTYEGVSLCEQLELNARQEGSDLKPYLRRMHLVVTAIREFLQAIETYKKVTHLTEEDREHLRRLQLQISTTEDLRCLFVLLLRRFNPSLHTKQYLQDLVVTNHILLLILDNVTHTESNRKLKMMDHVSQFATLEMMHFYGILLEDFNNNGEFINDCIFTMMHHIGGDLDQINTLFQPIILKTFSRMWEAEYELCDDWSDLIEYVIHKFINTPQKSPLALPTTSLTELTKEHNLENTVCSWTQEDMDTLYWYYVQSKKSNDIVGKIVSLFRNNGNKQKSRISIIQQLLQQDIITLVEYDDLMKFEDAEYQRALLTTPTSSTAESGIETGDSAKSTDDIQILLDLINKETKGKLLVWLQKLLLECCYIKLVLKSNVKNTERIMEPVAYHCIVKNKSIPIVQWNSDQANAMLYQPFVLLLHKLGFQLPADAGSIFARIPDFWTPEMMYSLAEKLGPLDKLFIKFPLSQLVGIDDNSATKELQGQSDMETMTPPVAPLFVEVDNNEEATKFTQTPCGLRTISEVDSKLERMSTSSSETFAMPKADHHANSMIRFIPEPSSALSMPNWLQLVMRSKCNLGASAGQSNESTGAATTTAAATATATATTTATATATTSSGNVNVSERTVTSSNTTSLWSAMMTTTITAAEAQAVATKAAIAIAAANLEHSERRQCINTAATTVTTTLTSQPLLSAMATAETKTNTSLLACSSTVNNIMGMGSLSSENALMISNGGVSGSGSGCGWGNSMSSSGENNNNHYSSNSNNSNTNTNNNTIIYNSNSSSGVYDSSSTTTSSSSILAADAIVASTLQSPSPPISSSSAMAAIMNEQHQLQLQQQYQQQNLQQHKHHIQLQTSISISDDDSAMRSFDRKDSNSSGFYTCSGSTNLESEYSAMVAAVFEHDIANSDSASVASDLTRMYVSDEDEKHEFRVAPFL